MNKHKMPALNKEEMKPLTIVKQVRLPGDIPSEDLAKAFAGIIKETELKKAPK